MLAIDWTQGFQDAWDDVAAFVPKLVAAIAIIIITGAIANTVRELIAPAVAHLSPGDLLDQVSAESNAAPAAAPAPTNGES